MRAPTFAPCALAVAAVLCTSWDVRAAPPMTSCAQVLGYFKLPVSSNLFARQIALEQAVSVVSQANPPCPDWLTEWALWSYADTLDRYSQTFPSGVAQSWTTKATGAYESYLTWLANMDERTRDDMIATLLKTNPSAADFAAKKRRWLQTRVGNSIVSLGALYVRNAGQAKLLVSYARLAEAAPVAAFPNEAVLEWHKWLKAQLDFQTEKSRGQIKGLIESRVECAAAWRAFSTFLDGFVAQNPSVKDDWKATREDLRAWLAR